MSAMDPRTPTRRLRVLLVEDDGDQGRLVSRWLEETGKYAVAHAANGPDGEAMIRSGDWDIVITDIQLPGMSGLDLLRVSKEVLRYTPTLLTTAHERLDYAVQAIRGRADDFLLKPLKREPFLEKVAALVEQGLTERRLHRRVVLAVGAHPDDVEIGCGGIILRHRAEGDEVTVLTLTGGELGGPAPERAEEAQRAAEILGADLILGALPDTAISEGLETISVIEAAVRKIQPTIIYTHTLRDGHQDHRSVHHATVVACRAVPALCCYQAPSTGIDFRPTRFVEVAEFMARKIQAIQVYGSQTAKRPYLRESLLWSTAEYWGRFAGYGMAEPLEVVRESA